MYQVRFKLMGQSDWKVMKTFDDLDSAQYFFYRSLNQLRQNQFEPFQSMISEVGVINFEGELSLDKNIRIGVYGSAFKKPSLTTTITYYEDAHPSYIVQGN